eukprot:1531449-Prymnesium_polylepis.1
MGVSPWSHRDRFVNWRELGRPHDDWNADVTGRYVSEALPELKRPRALTFTCAVAPQVLLD